MGQKKNGNVFIKSRMNGSSGRREQLSSNEMNRFENWLRGQLENIRSD